MVVTSLLIEDPSVEQATVAKKKQDATSNKQYNFRAPPELAARIDAVAEGLNVDGANLLRMIVTENLATYERRAKHAREGGTADPEPEQS